MNRKRAKKIKATANNEKAQPKNCPLGFGGSSSFPSLSAMREIISRGFYPV